MANELKRLLFSFFNGAALLVGLDGSGLLSFCGGCFESVASSDLGSSVLLCGFAATAALDGAVVDGPVDVAAGCGGRGPVLRCRVEISFDAPSVRS